MEAGDAVAAVDVLLGGDLLAAVEVGVLLDEQVLLEGLLDVLDSLRERFKKL